LIDGSCILLHPERKDHVWSYDFVRVRTRDGRAFRMVTVIDEFTRECLAIDAILRRRSDDVLERLADLFVRRGVSEHVHSDNGPEVTAEAVRGWLGRVRVKTPFIDPVSPCENGYVESFNGKIRDELLDREAFDTLLEAKVLIERGGGGTISFDRTAAWDIARRPSELHSSARRLWPNRSGH